MLAKYALLLILLSVLQPTYGNFEDTRCRCICPSTEFFRTQNNTPDENQRRYYTKTNVNSLTCNTHNVVKESVRRIVDDNRLDAFLANCNCKFESRNSMLLKNVVLLVIVVMLALAGYMTYLLALDPMLRPSAAGVAGAGQFVPYRRQEDDPDENVFGSAPSSSASPPGDLFGGQLADGATAAVDESTGGAALQLRGGARSGVLNKVEAEHGKWMSSVEEQRRKVLTDHTMLN